MIERVAAILMMREDGAILMQHRDEKPGLRCAGMWGLPGGHVEHGETALDCAKRELLEETDYDANDLRFLCSINETDEFCIEIEVTFFWCRYDSTQKVTCREGQALAFLKRSEAKNFRAPVPLWNVWDRGLFESGIMTSRAIK